MMYHRLQQVRMPWMPGGYVTVLFDMTSLNGTWMSRWKLGYMLSKWVIITYLYMGYIGVITHLLTIDPNFQRDIQVYV